MKFVEPTPSGFAWNEKAEKAIEVNVYLQRVGEVVKVMPAMENDGYHFDLALVDFGEEKVWVPEQSYEGMDESFNDKFVRHFELEQV